MKLFLIHSCAIVFLGFNSVFGQEPVRQKFIFPFQVDVYDLPTSTNGVDYRIYVRHPVNGIDSTKSYSSVFFLDPLSLFIPAASMTSNLEYFNYLPEAFYIGIGYQNESDGVIKSINRIRDYTPSKFLPDKNHFLFKDSIKYSQSGGLSAFTAIVKTEILPLIKKKYNVNNDRVLVGKSFSGLAATNILIDQPNLFNRYLIISPSLWWDDYSLKREERFIMKAIDNTDLKKISSQTRVYLAVGEEEENFGLVSDSRELVRKFNAVIPQANIHLDVLREEVHESIFPHAFMRGIQALYLKEPTLREKPIQIMWNK